MEAGQGRRRRRPSSTPRCARSPRACASSPCCCTPYMPEIDGEAAGRARRDGRPLRARRRGASARGPAGGRSASSPPLFPKPRVIDSPHPPRPRARRPRPSSSPRAREAGVTRILTIGMDSRVLPRGARRGRALRRRSSPRSAATPTSATGFDDAVADELRELAQHPRCRAIGETGLDYYRDCAPRADQERAFARPDRARARARQAARHPHARGRGRHDRHARTATRRASR